MPINYYCAITFQEGTALIEGCAYEPRKENDGMALTRSDGR